MYFYLHNIYIYLGHGIVYRVTASTTGNLFFFTHLLEASMGRGFGAPMGFSRANFFRANGRALLRVGSLGNLTGVIPYRRMRNKKKNTGYAQGRRFSPAAIIQRMQRNHCSTTQRRASLHGLFPPSSLAQRKTQQTLKQTEVHDAVH